MRVRSATVLFAAAVAAACPLAAGAVARGAPPPGSSPQVRALVAASHTVRRIPASLTPGLGSAAQDNAATAYPTVKYGCNTMTQCVFGDATGSQTMVLFGDSHAEMWLSSLIPYAQSHALRLVLLTTLGCPAANVTVWLSPQGYYTACDSGRQEEIGLIVGAKPAIVVVAERTAHLKRSPTKYFTNAQWQSGLESTLSQLKASGASLVVLGDTTVINVNPPECLAANPTRVQRCGNANPNPRLLDQTHARAEKAAAKAQGAAFVNPVPWLCTRTCSPIIGNMVAYWDAYHITNTYATYLSRVLDLAIAAALP